MTIILFHTTSVDTELTAHDWNQESLLVLLRKEDGCLAIWLNQLLSLGFLAQDLHRRQQ